MAEEKRQFLGKITAVHPGPGGFNADYSAVSHDTLPDTETPVWILTAHTPLRDHDPSIQHRPVAVGAPCDIWIHPKDPLPDVILRVPGEHPTLKECDPGV